MATGKVSTVTGHVWVLKPWDLERPLFSHANRVASLTRDCSWVDACHCQDCIVLLWNELSVPVDFLFFELAAGWGLLVGFGACRGVIWATAFGVAVLKQYI